MLFCSSFYVYFVCFLPLGLQLNSPAFLENYLLAWKIRKSSGKDKEKLTSQEIRKVLEGVFLPLENIWIVICQVTAADKLRDLNSFCDRWDRTENGGYELCGSLDPSTPPHGRKRQRKPAPGNRAFINLAAPSSWLHRHLAWFGMTWPDCLELASPWWSLPGAGRHRYLPQPYREGPAIYWTLNRAQLFLEAKGQALGHVRSSWG